MAEISIPKLNNNDSSYLLVEWLFEDGATVPDEAGVAVLETSKASEELIVPVGGTLHQMVPAGAEYPCGTVIGRLGDGERPAPAPVSTPNAARAPGEAELIITEPARELAEQLGIDTAQLRTLGSTVIKRADVARLADARSADDPGVTDDRSLHRLSRNQQGVWAVVSESQRTIPAAFTVTQVGMDELEAYTAESGTMAGATEFVIAAMARLRTDFPLFFSAPAEPGSVRLSSGAHIAVTVDVGKGLFTPVVRNADQLSVAEIADVMMGVRIKAIQDGFRAADLTGGTALLALNNDPDISLATPIIFPGNTCAVSLAGTRDELFADPAGGVGVRRVAALGVAYDHRVINGRDAARFLRALRQRVEAPAELAVDGARPAPVRTSR